MPAGDIRQASLTRAFWQKLEEIVESSQVVIDRPRGSTHPRYPSIVYPADYGYLEGTVAMDGSGIDVWRGAAGIVDISAIIVTLDSIKQDSEIKVLLGCSEQEIETIYLFHNEHESMKGLLIYREDGETIDGE